MVTIEDEDVYLSKDEWPDGVEFTLHSHNVEQLINDIEKWGELYEGIKEIVDKVEKNICIWTNTETVILNNDQWTKELEFPLDKELYDSDSLIDEVSDFFDLKYIPVKACYTEDYFEVFVNLPEIFWGDGLSGVHFLAEDEEQMQDRIHYEISNISPHFANLIELKQGYSDFEVVDSFSTLKIYNINKITEMAINNSEFEERIWYFAKCILFELSSKHSLAINFYELPEDEEDGYDLEEMVDSLNDTESPYLRKFYDSDLIDYYHRALVMLDSEFKYLSFYQRKSVV